MQLFPYIYTQAHTAHEVSPQATTYVLWVVILLTILALCRIQTGLPIMRQHILHFPNDTTAIKQAQQVLGHVHVVVYMTVCMYAPTYVCTYVCVHMYIHIYIIPFILYVVHVWSVLPGCSGGKGRIHFMGCLPTSTWPEGTNKMARCWLNSTGLSHN